MERRPVRQLLWRAIGCLLLIILLPFNATGFEREEISHLFERKSSSYVSKVMISKNIIIGYTTKQKSVFTTIDFGDRDPVGALNNTRFEPDLLRPHCRCCRERVGGASIEDRILDIVQGSAQSLLINKNNKTLVRDSSRSEPIILITITEIGLRHGLVGRSVWLAVYKLGRGEPEAVKNGADIGAELVALRISGNNSLGDPYNHYYGRDYRIESDQSYRPYLTSSLMLISCGLLFVLSNILVTKAVKRSYDTIYLCLAWLTGFVSLAAPALRIIWH
jgi:hypothetical protein